MPIAAYLAAISIAGVGVLHVLSGERHAGSADAMSQAEFAVLQNLRSLNEADRAVVIRLSNALAATSQGKKTEGSSVTGELSGQGPPREGKANGLACSNSTDRCVVRRHRYAWAPGACEPRNGA